MQKDNRVESANNLMADMTTGLSDGIVVLLALTAGLGRVMENDTTLYLSAGVAILIGATAIALSRYYTEKENDDHDHDAKEQESLQHLGFSEVTKAEIIAEMQKDKSDLEQMLTEESDIAVARRSAAKIAIFYLVGGLFPLLPYILITDRQNAFISSALVAVLSLVLVGYIKAQTHNRNIGAEILRQSITGALAAAAGYFVGGIFI